MLVTGLWSILNQHIAVNGVLILLVIEESAYMFNDVVFLYFKRSRRLNIWEVGVLVACKGQ